MKKSWSGRFDVRVVPPEPRKSKGGKLKIYGSIADDPTDLLHGTINGYLNYGCRCDRCKAARDKRVQRRKDIGLSETDPRHGTLNGYCTYACRCDSCKAANAAYQKQRYHARKAQS